MSSWLELTIARVCTFDLPTDTIRIGRVVLVLAIETASTGAGVASLEPVLYIMKNN